QDAAGSLGQGYCFAIVGRGDAPEDLRQSFDRGQHRRMLLAPVAASHSLLTQVSAWSVQGPRGTGKMPL
ncbi:MAG: hypothetical protein ACI82F_003350, partial [Planctomycetota bacterium]